MTPGQGSSYYGIEWISVWTVADGAPTGGGTTVPGSRLRTQDVQTHCVYVQIMGVGCVGVSEEGTAIPVREKCLQGPRKSSECGG